MTRRKEHEMTPRKRNIPFLIVLGLTAGALIIPSAQAGGPDDRPLYRGTSPAAVLGSMSQDDRNFNRGTSQSSTSVSMSPDDRSYYRGGTADLSVANVPSSSITPDDRSFTRHTVAATSSPVAVQPSIRQLRLARRSHRRSLRHGAGPPRLGRAAVRSAAPYAQACVDLLLHRTPVVEPCGLHDQFRE